MKAILFFVAAGIVSEANCKTADAIAKETGKRVVFRNASSAEQTSERPEPNDGVAGVVPSTYKAFPRYDDAGKLASEGEVTTEDAPEQALNALGLPEGHPDDKEGLKAALASEGVDFHPNTGINKLVALYKEQFNIEIPE